MKARQMTASIWIAILIWTIAQPPSIEASPIDEREPLGSIYIHQTLQFEADPSRVYRTLLDAKQFGELSKSKATISPETGKAFSLFDGQIVGRNIDVVANSRIVQAWRAAAWPEGVYSMVKFELKPKGSGTELVFEQIGFPQGLHDHLAQGWEANYWTLLRGIK